MQKYTIKNVQVVNEGSIQAMDVFIRDGRIEKLAPAINTGNLSMQEIDGTGKYLLPGLIDDQVHFREPGLTHKAEIHTESGAAVAGGITSFMEMPNTQPKTLTQKLLEDKYELASRASYANYSFFMGVSNDNAEEVLKTNEKKDRVCGVKIFMGASTGEMLVDNLLTLEKIFAGSELLIATHCEDERIIKRNLELVKKDGRTLTAADHPLIRNEEACFESSLLAIQIAKKHNTRLHILHISTARELNLFSNMLSLEEKRITSEVCVHHLHFTAHDYDEKGYLIKCNPAIKESSNREALWEALLDDRLDVIATDHAPHTLEEKGYVRKNDGSLELKNKDYAHAHAGLPLVQHSLPLLLYYHKQGRISLEKIVEKTSHNLSRCFNIRDRGYIREGYMADLVMVDMDQPFRVTRDNLFYKCGWSPLEGTDFPASITHTFVNGHLVFEHGKLLEAGRGERLLFNT